MTQDQENEKLSLLSVDERKRAFRYHLPIHRQRFIAARSSLRQILSNYIKFDPKEFVFIYDEHEKPHLNIPAYPQLQFNLSHSSNMAVYAFTLNHPIGIDIEKVQSEYNQAVADRFFSTQENEQLLQFSAHERIAGFYRIWSRKEAIIKAIGKGLSLPLTSFTVSAKDITEVIILDNRDHWTLIPLQIRTGYQSAVATNQPVRKVIYWNYSDQSPKLDKVSIL